MNSEPEKKSEANRPPVAMAIERAERLAQLRHLARLNRRAWDKYASFARDGSSSVTTEQAARIDAEAPFSNEERAELETLEFITDPPARRFAYPSPDGLCVVNWMGVKLATITHKGLPFRSNMGDQRQSFHAMGINGVRYVGTIYGTYLRMRPAASAPKLDEVRA